MFDNILVGVDEHQGSRDAIALAGRLLARDGKLTLAHVYPGEAHPWRGSSPEYDAAQRGDALALLKSLADGLELRAELEVAGAPSVGRGLHLTAERLGADLLVVGTTRHGLVGRVWIGDDTRAALNGAPCAVAVAPAGYEREPATMREIGVGYDGSPESEHALAIARCLAAEFGTRLSAFEAVALPSYLFSGAAPVQEETLDELVESARERVAALAGVEPHAAYGHPAEELAGFSASLDLLVVGSRGYGPLGRLVHGSTSLALARMARCPLLVMTRAARAHDEALPGLDQSVLERVPHEVGPRAQP